MTAKELSDINFETCFYSSSDVDTANNTARDLIAAVAKIGGGCCYLGKIHDKKGLQNYRPGDRVYNFSCDFALPEFNANIDRILREYTAEVYNIADIITENGGYLVFWK